MKKFTKSIALVCIFSIVLCCFTCCGKEAQLEWPADSVSNSTDGEDAKATYKNATIFLDNTNSCYGYVMAGSGKKSEYVDILNSLTDFMSKYSNENYYALKDSGNTTKWVSKTKESFKKYTTKKFYEVYNAISNPFTDVDTTKGLNIYITDLAEGAATNKDLAESINSNILSKKNYSAALYCFVVNYYGVNSTDDNSVISDSKGTVKQTVKKTYVKNKPFYMFVAGPTAEVVSFRDNFNSSLEDKNYELNKDFYCSSFLSGRGLQTSKADLDSTAFEVTETSLKTDSFKKLYTNNNTDLNYNVVKADPVSAFNIKENLDGLFFRTSKLISDDDASGDEQYHSHFSFLCNLPNKSDGEPATDATYTLELTDAYYSNEETADTVENEDGENISIEKFAKMTDDRFFDIFEAKDNEQISYTCEYKASDFSITKLKDDELVQKFKDDGKVTDKDNTVNVKVGKSGALYITVNLNGGKDFLKEYDCVIMQFSVKGIVNVSDDRPDWVNRFDADTAKRNSAYNKNTCAESLAYIYDYLNGTMSNEEAKAAYQESMSTEVCTFTVFVDLRGNK